MREHNSNLHDRVARKLFAATRHAPPRMRTINTCSLVLAVVLTIVTMFTLRMALSTQDRINQMNKAYQSCQTAVDELQLTSNLLTSESRQFVATGKRIHMDNYLDEIQTNDHRGKALQTLYDLAANTEAIAALEEARARSDKLSQTELRALRLKAEALNMDHIPDAVADAPLKESEAALPAKAKEELASELLSDSDYTHTKFQIREHVQSCSLLLVDTLQKNLSVENARLARLLVFLRISILLLLLVLLFVIASTSLLLLWPIALYEKSIREDEPLQLGGAKELHHLTTAYNEMFAENHEREESLTFEAHNDALTGVLNRGSFDELLTRHKENSALILVDIDNFKQFNDEHGHDMGDAILIEVAATLYGSFKSTDHICRIGGDEFAVIMTNAHLGLEEVVAQRIKKVAAFLRDTSNGLPAATISVGIAFGYEGCADDRLFQLADGALYQVKRNGRDSFAFADQKKA